MKVKTDGGFECDIDIEKLQDWQFIDLMSQVESDNDSNKITATVGMVKYIFGDDYNKFIEYVKDQNGGSAPVTAVVGELTSILKKVGEAKK